MRIKEILKPVSMPDSYAHSELETKQAEFDRLPVRLAYQKTWERGLRFLDDAFLKGGVAKLRTALKEVPLDQHQPIIDAHWNDVANSSHFSIYQQAHKDYLEEKGGTPPPAPLTYGLLINSIIGGSEREKTFAHETFFQQLKEMGADNATIAYITSLFYYHNSRLIALHTVENGIKSASSTVNRLFADIHFKNIIKEAEPYVIRAEQLSGQIKAIELKLFGPNARIAGRLWRTCLFLKTKALPPYLSASEVRQPLLESLLNRSYDEAKAYVKKLIAYNPNLVQGFVKDELNSLKAVPVEQAPAGETSAADTNQDTYLPMKLADLAKECGVPKGTISRRVRKLLKRFGSASGILKTQQGYSFTKEALERIRSYETDYRESKPVIPQGYERLRIGQLAKRVGYSVTQLLWHIKRIRKSQGDEFLTINTAKGKLLCVTPEGELLIEHYFHSLSKTH